MELLKLSKFKLQLRNLITEFREAREKERYASEQLHLLDQKQKETESEFNGKLAKLQAELATSNELRQKLETKVNYLQNDNALLENKQKELQGTINKLLQSRENFAKVYEDSTCEMKRAIEYRDRKISVLSEKINAHISLFASIEKEAFFVKKVVDNAQHVLSEKEEVVAGLKIKVDKVAILGTEFVEKISKLETKLRSNEDELRRKEKIILELEAQLEAAKNSDKGQSHIEELQETLLAKERIIQSLISEKKALHFELGSLQIIIKKVQDTVEHLNEEIIKPVRVYKDIYLLTCFGECEPTACYEIVRLQAKSFEYFIRYILELGLVKPLNACLWSLSNQSSKESGRAFSLMLASQECAADEEKENHRAEDALTNTRGNSPHESFLRGVAEVSASILCQESHDYDLISKPLKDTTIYDSCVSESACSEPQSAANVLSISGVEAKDNCRTLVNQLDSECSTTQAETS